MQLLSITARCVHFELDDNPHLEELMALPPPAHPPHRAHPPLPPLYQTEEGRVCI